MTHVRRKCRVSDARAFGDCEDSCVLFESIGAGFCDTARPADRLRRLVRFRQIVNQCITVYRVRVQG